MGPVLEVVQLLLFVYLLLLMGRLVLSWVVMFAQQWTPTGIALVGAETIMTLTDPPIRAMRKVVPSPQIGPIRLDLSFLLVLVIVMLLRNVVLSLR